MQEIEKVFREIYQESGIKDDITNIHNINIQKAHIKSYLSKRYNKKAVDNIMYYITFTGNSMKFADY